MSQSKIDEILALIHKGSKLAAVKVLMDASDLGLKEAKDIIDGIATGEQKELNTAIKQAKSRYTDNYESISATCDPDGSNVRFFYQKGTIKEEVTPGHPMWQRVKNHYGIPWEGAPEDILKAREPFLKAVQEMEAQSAIHLEKKNTLFIKDDNMIDGLKWYFIIFLILCAILYFVFK
ncbi:MAG: 50S ribosomal protein L7/L12 [Capnocytophaga sp.]|nr:MAG: 50S ribosomal protein L7/L12 [Capnocytophaga sp.]